MSLLLWIFFIQKNILLCPVCKSRSFQWIHNFACSLKFAWNIFSCNSFAVLNCAFLLKKREEEWLNLTLLSHCWLLSIISLLHAQFSDYRYHNQCSAKIFHSEWLPVERMFLQYVSTMLLHHYKAASNCSVSQLKLVD